MKEYKAARNRVTREIRTARYMYENDLASKIKTDRKIFCNYIRTQANTRSIVSKSETFTGELAANDQQSTNG